MEVATLAGLFGLSYLVSKVNKPGSPPQQNQSQTEGFLPAARAPDTDVLTQTEKGQQQLDLDPNLT